MRPFVLVACLFVTAVASPQLSIAATPQLPLSDYKPLPVGTMIECDTWRCEITRSGKRGIEGRDGDGNRTRFADSLIPYGKAKGVPPLGFQGPVITVAGYDSSQIPLKLNSIKLDNEDLTAVMQLWPLEVGKSAEFKPRYDGEHAGSGNMKVSSKITVDRTEQVNAAGQSRNVFVIIERIRRKETSYRSSVTDELQRTLWFAPDHGVIVREELEYLAGPRGGNKFTYALTGIEFPKDAPAVAQGDKDAKKNMGIVKKEMTPAQIAEAQNLASEY